MTSVFHNPSHQKTEPRLSVLIPFFKDDPSALIEALPHKPSKTFYKPRDF